MSQPHPGGLPNAETPIDEHNHTMDALRYLICGIDAHRLAKSAHTANVALDPKAQPEPPPKPKQKPWLRDDNEELWTRIF